MFYVHIADPGFSASDDRPENEDFPFGRRLGPFLTVEEATAQAVSDLAGGQMSEANCLGVFEASESEKARDQYERDEDGGYVTDPAGVRERKADQGTPVVTPEQLVADAEQERARREQERAATQALTHPDEAAMWDAIEAAASDPRVLAFIASTRAR